MSSAARQVAVAIGTFDGVHLGHRRVVEEALATGLPVRALTFHPHPRGVVSGNLVELISTLERRLELLSELGVAETTVVDFTLELAAQEPEVFAAEWLADAAVIVAGEDFRFGRGRTGDLDLLERAGLQRARCSAAGRSLVERDSPSPARRRSRRRCPVAGSAA